MIRVVTFLGGLYFFLEFLLPKEFLGFSFAPYHEFITNGFLAVGVTAIGLGLVSILRVHGVRVVTRRTGWFSSGLLLTAMTVMLVVTSYEAILDRRDARIIERASLLREFAGIVARDGGTAKISEVDRINLAIDAIGEFDQDVAALTQVPEVQGGVLEDLVRVRAAQSAALSSARALRTRESLTALADSLGQEIGAVRAYQNAVRESSLNRGVYNLIYQGLWTALAAAMFSLLGFYIAAAAYRAFRVRSMESALMMTAAIVVMLGQIPFGVWLYEGLPALRSWLLSVPSSAAFRAIRLGAGVAGLLMALRMWLSLDRRGGNV